MKHSRSSLAGLFLITLLSFPLVAAHASEKESLPKQSTEIKEENKKMTETPTSQSYLEENKSKPGVISLADGLQYKILKEGTGKKPKISDTVTVHYKGSHVDGTEFDSSYERGEPASFPLNGVIAGWTEALQLMPVGSTWEIVIPGHLAYGEQGMPPVIGPNETLVFKVELLSIN